MSTSTSRETSTRRRLSLVTLEVSLPTCRKRNYDIKSAYPGNQEQIILEAPVPGRYYIVLYGYESYNMVGFEAEYR